MKRNSKQAHLAEASSPNVVQQSAVSLSNENQNETKAGPVKLDDAQKDALKSKILARSKPAAQKATRSASSARAHKTSKNKATAQKKGMKRVFESFESKRSKSSQRQPRRETKAEFEARRKRQIALAISLSVFICVLLLFTASLFFFDAYYPPNTYFQGENLSLKLKRDSFDQGMDEQFSIKADGKDILVIPFSEIDGQVRTHITNNPYGIRWIENALNGLELQGEKQYFYNEDKLRAYVNQHIAELQGDREPVDARIVAKKDHIELVPEVNSNRFEDAQAFVNAVVEAVNNGKNEINAEDYYRKASIRQDDLQGEFDRIRGMRIDVPDLNLEIGPEVILGLYNSDMTVNHEAVESYVWDLSSTYDTYDKVREFKTVHGTTIEVPPGVYGWRMDVSETVDRLEKILKNEGRGSLEVSYLMRAKQRGDDDIGDTYVEVDREAQRTYVIKDGQLVADFRVVTGDPYYGDDTDAGVHQILSKSATAVLKGEGPEKRDNYEVPVTNWCPFNWSGEGFHSADWYQDWQFGGTTYLGGGSHGCVNMRAQDAKLLYDLIDVGDPVIVY